MGKAFLVALLLVCTGCGDDIFIFDPDPTPTPEPTSTPLPDPVILNPVCDGLQPINDGRGGFLWKDAEADGSLVVLLPGRFPVEFPLVTAELKNGSLETLRFTGFDNPDSDGLRGHYRSVRKLREFKDNGFVTASEPGNTCRWQIGDASRRND